MEVEGSRMGFEEIAERAERLQRLWVSELQALLVRSHELEEYIEGGESLEYCEG